MNSKPNDNERSFVILSLVKALHIAALVVWCAGLLGLPLMLSKHEIGEGQASYSQLRLLTHRAYSYLVTPAAIIAISAGTLLIFLAGVFTLWMFVKLLMVGVLVAWLGWTGLLFVLEMFELRKIGAWLYFRDLWNAVDLGMCGLFVYLVTQLLVCRARVVAIAVPLDTVAGTVERQDGRKW